MSTVLRLQRLTPTVRSAEFNVALGSSVSVVCPPVPGGDLPSVAMD